MIIGNVCKISDNASKSPDNPGKSIREKIYNIIEYNTIKFFFLIIAFTYRIFNHL